MAEDAHLQSPPGKRPGLVRALGVAGWDALEPAILHLGDVGRDDRPAAEERIHPADVEGGREEEEAAVHRLGHIYPSPGYLDEKIEVYAAEVEPADTALGQDHDQLTGIERRVVFVPANAL